MHLEKKNLELKAPAPVLKSTLSDEAKKAYDESTKSRSDTYFKDENTVNRELEKVRIKELEKKNSQQELPPTSDPQLKDKSNFTSDSAAATQQELPPTSDPQLKDTSNVTSDSAAAAQQESSPTPTHNAEKNSFFSNLYNSISIFSNNKEIKENNSDNKIADKEVNDNNSNSSGGDDFGD